jgi:hypothetical protein
VFSSAPVVVRVEQWRFEVAEDRASWQAQEAVSFSDSSGQLIQQILSGGGGFAGYLSHHLPILFLRSSINLAHRLAEAAYLSGTRGSPIPMLRIGIIQNSSEALQECAPMAVTL